MPAVRLFASTSPASTDSGGSNLGFAFQVSEPAYVLSLWLYIHPTAGAFTWTIWLYDASNATQLATASLGSRSGATNPGWNEGVLASPYLIPAATTYRVAGNNSSGSTYSYTNNGLLSAQNNGILSSLANGGRWGSASANPTNVIARNYFRDVTVISQAEYEGGGLLRRPASFNGGMNDLFDGGFQ